jgi:hypothetical protein
MSIVNEFSRKIDFKNDAHVDWLRSVCRVMKPTGPQASPPDIHGIFQRNPMNIVVTKDDMLRVAEIHFLMCLQFTMATLLPEGS